MTDYTHLSMRGSGDICGEKGVPSINQITLFRGLLKVTLRLNVKGHRRRVTTEPCEGKLHARNRRGAAG